MLHFHKWLTMDLNLTYKIRFKIPFYYRKSWVCYLNSTKQGNIDLLLQGAMSYQTHKDY
jgi:hypothetical protein